MLIRLQCRKLTCMHVFFLLFCFVLLSAIVRYNELVEELNESLPAEKQLPVITSYPNVAVFRPTDFSKLQSFATGKCQAELFFVCCKCEATPECQAIITTTSIGRQRVKLKRGQNRVTR